MRHLVALLVILCTASPLLAGETLDRVKRFGRVRCGVSDWMPGFALRDDNGVWTGMDVDFCRAVAAAVRACPTNKHTPAGAPARSVARCRP